MSPERALHRYYFKYLHTVSQVRTITQWPHSSHLLVGFKYIFIQAAFKLYILIYLKYFLTYVVFVFLINKIEHIYSILEMY